MLFSALRERLSRVGSLLRAIFANASPSMSAIVTRGAMASRCFSGVHGKPKISRSVRCW